MSKSHIVKCLFEIKTSLLCLIYYKTKKYKYLKPYLANDGVLKIIMY